MEDVTKASTCTQDAGAEIAQIKVLMKRIKFDVELSLTKGHQQMSVPFSRIPLQHLIKECNEIAKKTRSSIHRS